MKFVAFCNVLIVLGCIALGLLAMTKGHPVYAGFALASAWGCTMNFKSKK